MLSILSPAKTLDFESKCDFTRSTVPFFLQESTELISELRTFDLEGLGVVMQLSDKLSKLNLKRYQSWTTSFTQSNSRQSIFCFKGGVYKGLEVDSFSKEDLVYSQDYLRILSGLHGVLKPLDLIQAYRLEMGTKLQTSKGKNLYEFWGDKITNSLNQTLQDTDSNYLLNLASNEYFYSVNAEKIKAKIIGVNFLDKKNDTYKIISFFAKKARGSMAAFVLKNKIKKLEDLKQFNDLGYVFDQSRSNDMSLTFIR